MAQELADTLAKYRENCQRAFWLTVGFDDDETEVDYLITPDSLTLAYTVEVKGMMDTDEVTVN